MGINHREYDMRNCLVILLFVLSENLYANCSNEEEIELKETLYKATKPLKFLNIDNECRFTVYLISDTYSAETDWILIRDRNNNIPTTVKKKLGKNRWAAIDGKSIVYFDTSFTQKMSEKSYKMGVKDGSETIWFSNGNIKSESHFVNSIPDGVETIWSEDGKKASERFYKNGLLDNKLKSKALNKESGQELSQFDNAKQKCKDLGFKEKTEKFGSCVLELTK